MLLHVWRACLSARTVCLLIRAVARARVSADTHVCARVRVCLRVPLGLSVCACVHSVCERTVRACASRLHAPSHRTAATCGINGSARVARGCVRCHRPGSYASAAGVSWTSRTLKAGWAARCFHTSVVDAAGAIYVIGGFSYTGGGTGGIYYQDVWVSTDGGARTGLGQGDGRGILKGVPAGVLQGY
jgi:hypothetical protein